MVEIELGGGESHVVEGFIVEMEGFGDFPLYGTLEKYKGIGDADLVKQSIHVKKELPDFGESEVSTSTHLLILRDFQINLAKKLASNEGTFIVTKL